MKRHVLIAALLLGLVMPALAGHVCGTAQIMESLSSNRNIFKQRLAAKPSARTTSTGCTFRDLYDSVYSRTTKHFEIFYTLNGAHKTTTAFIDSLEKALEYAWDFHVNKSGMLPPKGYTESYHYEKRVQDGLYPIEVIDLYHLQNYTNAGLREPCRECFGLTLTNGDEASEMLIDNDFRIVPETSTIIDTVEFNGKVCTYARASEEFLNTSYNYSYAKNFMAALRVTSIHEMYHGIQFRYSSKMPQYNFWFEASASGVEEIAAPDIDDYFIYLPKLSRNNGFALKNLEKPYGAGIFFMYLNNHVSPKTNRLIWENFAKEPKKSFQYQLEQVAKGQGLSADSLFHDFIIRLSFTGERSSLVDSTFWITSDQPNWPEFQSEPENGTFTPYDLDYTAYAYFANGVPDMSKFTGRASAIAIKPNDYSIRFLPSTNSVDSTQAEFLKGVSPDSILWVFSRFNEEEVIPTHFKDSTLRAYPTPWRQGSLCFTPLPQDKDFIEIRNRRGNLVSKIRYSSYTHCLDEGEVKSLLVPGVYRFRVGNSGKLKDFIIVY